MFPSRWLRSVVFLVLAFVASVALAQTAPPIRIMPLGDSITYGSGAAGGYRNRLYQILTAAGYNVDFVGTQKDNGTGTLPDSDHEGHSGWRIDQLDSNIAGWLGTLADPDVILLHIGTNDFGQGLDTANAINRLDGLISKIATLRPYAHIIVTNLMERGEPYNTSIQTQFNPFVQDRVNTQASFGRRVTFLDMRSAVPITDMPDQLHPNQAGYDKMANAWLPAIQAVTGPQGDSSPPGISRAVGTPDRSHVVITFSKPVADSAASMGNYSISGGLTISNAQLDAAKRSVTLTTSAQQAKTTYTVTVNGVNDRTTAAQPLAANSTAAFFGATPRGYANNVPESSAYTLAYSIDLPTAADYKNTSVNYSVDNHLGVGSFDRIAYYLELQQPDGDVQYVWAAMDAFTNDSGKIAIPTLASGAQFQQGVTGLNIVSNVTGIVNGTGLSGNLEFWPTNYAAENTPAPGVSGASNTLYDFGDHPTPGSYGSMQLHNAAAAQTVFALNNWGGNTNPGDLDIGIGNNPAPTNNGVDWTFAHNAASYSVKTLQVLVRTQGDNTAPTLVGASASFGRTKVIVTFSEPIAPQSVQATNFAINGNVAVLGATLAANQRDVILTTTAQPTGTPLTVTVSGIRDSSASANRIAANSTIAVAAPSLPSEITTNVGAAAANYQLVCSINLPSVGNFNSSSSAFTYDDRSAPGAFGRVAYYLELQKPGGPVQFVWTSMDAFTMNKAKLALPTVASGAVYQRNVTNLEVISNVGGVVNGSAMAGGNIEFWPNDYNATNGANVPNASATTYDFGDTRAATGGSNYGSMQVHNHDSAANQTVFAINHFGADGNRLDLGIGNNSAPVNGGVDWTFAANADGYSRRVLHVLVLPSQPTSLPAVVANVPEAAGYQLAYSITIPASGNVSSLVYSVDNHNEIGPFSRVAYYMELQTGTATPNYIWTSMDAFTSDAGKVAIPTAASGAVFQQNVTDLNVASNVPGIVTGTGMTGGNIEFWPTNYSAPNAVNVPNADATSYDFGDTRTTSGTYGSMQVHNHDPAALQTLFAFNNWGAASPTNNTFCLGIGNNPNPGAVPNRGVDWTFANNAGSYSSRVLHVFVLPGDGDTTPPAVVRATGSVSLNRLVVSFNEPVADTSAVPANFSIGGLTVTGATLLPGQREVMLTTSAQTAGTTYTVNVTGVRDRSAAGNLILAGATASFAAPVPEPVLANIPEAAGYTLVNKLAIPDVSAFNTAGVPYTIDESRFPQTQAFDRVAYCLELQLAGGGASTWVYVSADAFTSSLSQVGVPAVASGAIFQQNLANMNVFASAGTTVTTGTGLTGGNIEFWPNDYTAANGANVLNASATNYDFGDTRSAAVGYGSMQIHNHDASQTIFAFNNWGGKGGNNDVGIGNDPAPVTAGVDWTFHHNAATFSTKNLYVLVRPGGVLTGAAPRLLSQPTSRTLNSGASTTLAVSASGTAPLFYQWRFNGTPITGATDPWLDIAGFNAAQAGTYDVVVTASGSASVTSQGAVLSLSGATNRPPTFSGYAFTNRVNEAVMVTLSSLLAKASDPDNDTLTISAVSPGSTQGGTVSLGASGVTYSPATGFVGNDSFTITVSDGKGGTVQGTVTATVTSIATLGGAQSAISIRADGKVDALFRGTPGRQYQVERSVDLVNWVTLTTVSAGDDGVVPFTDPAPPAGRAFYRTRAVGP